MNNTPIPPIHAANRPLVSTGRGNGVKWGRFPAANVANNAWSANAYNIASVTAGSYQTPTGLSVTVTGFSSYVIHLQMVVKNNDTGASRTVLTRIYQGTTAYANSVGYAIASLASGAIVSSAVVTGLNPYQSYTFNGQVSFGGTTAGSVQSSTISAIGLG